MRRARGRVDRELLARAEHLVGGRDHRVDVLGNARRALVGRIRDGEPAAEVVRAEVAERGDRLDRQLPPRREVEELRADVDVQAFQVGPRRVCEVLDRARRVGEREAELRARVAGQDRGVRVGDDARRNADHHLDRGGDPIQLVDLVEVVDDDPRARLGRGGEPGARTSRCRAG